MEDAEAILSQKEDRDRKIKENLRRVAEWFHQHEGNLFLKEEAVSKISQELEAESDIATKCINSLVGDHVDPVQQILTDEGQYVGVIEYNEADGYYTYTEDNDVTGQHTRAVCGHCVNSSEHSSEPFTRHTGMYGNKPHNDVEELHTIIEDHIDEKHDGEIEVETGATLASGTTISGNTSIHTGNLDTSYTFTASQNFNAGLTVDGGSFVNRTLAQGDSLTVPSSDGMIVAGPYTLDGTLTADGTFATTGPISGTGTIKGTGKVVVLD